MTGTPLDLLQLLAAGAQGVRRAAGLTPGQVEGADFASLLKRAGEGGLASGREVTIDERAGVQLTPDQLARIGAAADTAEAQGATRAVVLIDGMALRLDVTLREVTGSADLSGGGVLTGLDSLVSVPPVGGAEAAQVVPLPNARGAGLNPSLLQALMGRKG